MSFTHSYGNESMTHSIHTIYSFIEIHEHNNVDSEIFQFNIVILSYLVHLYKISLVNKLYRIIYKWKH